ncbi:hypothetical protein [Peribacillus butanolivorans]|uniref:hypothetical protein n=1 Tax=Peribacillus butanolivorans TaxID=421767 RepID=UPI00381E0916
MSRIYSLAVRVVTSSDFRAGTDNEVYFDVGPLGWKLFSEDNDFERGDNRTYDLDLHGLELYTDDLVWLRLHKKGSLGVSGTTDFPDGNWKPESIHLIVNGREYFSARVDEWLNSSRNFWVKFIRSYEDKELFVRTLRMLPNYALSNGDEKIAWVSTIFKRAGISGWLKPNVTGGPNINRATAIGKVLRMPGKSTDGLATIDLQLEAIEINGSRYFVDGLKTRGISLQRYIRVEYQYKRAWPNASEELDVPSNGQRMRISGEIWWDTDEEGWYEIHPAGPEDLEWLAPPPKLINLTSEFSEEFGPLEKGVVHWPGCNVKGTPEEWAKPRDFTFEKQLVYQKYIIGAVVQDMGPHTEIFWKVDGKALQQGSGTFQSNSVLVSYHLEGLSIELWNRPEDGVTTFDLHVSINDPYQPTHRSLGIFFDGIRITYEPDYYRIVGGCSLAKYMENQRIKTNPQVVPRWDPARLIQLEHEVLVDLVGKITEENGLTHAWRETAKVMDKALIVNTLLGLSVRYPETAAKIIPGRIN